MNKIIRGVIIFTIAICLFFIPTMFANTDVDDNIILEKIFYNNGEFAWPIPGYTAISSPFGKRRAPTSGASTFHKGTDIPAPEGTALVATCDGEITFIGFLGGGGYTITITTATNLKISYCHVSPNYIVEIGQHVKQGELIGNVGPKYVYDVSGNTYKDSSGKTTNGATTRMPFTYRIQTGW